MSREIIIKDWCDLHQANKQEKVPSTTVVTFGMVAEQGVRPALFEMDVCAECFDIVDGTLADWFKIAREAKLNGTAAPVKAPVKKVMVTPDAQGWFDCPVCQKELASRGSLVGHVWSQHRLTDKPKQPKACPDCGERFPNAAGMAIHRQSAHGYDNLAEALQGLKYDSR